MIESETTVGRTLGALSAFTDRTTISSLGQWEDAHAGSLTRRNPNYNSFKQPVPSDPWKVVEGEA